MPRLAPVLGALVLAAALLGPPAATAVAPACPVTAGSVDVTRADIVELRAALAAGAVTSHQLTQTYLERIAAVNHAGPGLHAVIAVAPDALAQADAADAAARVAGAPALPLRGIPVLVKDNLDTFDLPTTAGAVAMLGAPPPRDAYVVRRLRAAGAVILGKTNLPVLAGDGQTDSAACWWFIWSAHVKPRIVVVARDGAASFSVRRLPLTAPETTRSFGAG